MFLLMTKAIIVFMYISVWDAVKVKWSLDHSVTIICQRARWDRQLGPGWTGDTHTHKLTFSETEWEETYTCSILARPISSCRRDTLWAAIEGSQVTSDLWLSGRPIKTLGMELRTSNIRQASLFKRSHCHFVNCPLMCRQWSLSRHALHCSNFAIDATWSFAGAGQELNLCMSWYNGL